MRQHRFLLFKLSASILIPALIAVGAGWHFFSTPEKDTNSLSTVAPMTEAFLKATVREYSKLTREFGTIDSAGLGGLLDSSEELVFLTRFGADRQALASASRGANPKDFNQNWAVKRPAFGFLADATPIVVTPLPQGGWVVTGLNLEAIKRTWGIPRSLRLRQVRPTDHPDQVVHMKGYTLPGQGPWSGELGSRVEVNKNLAMFELLKIGFAVVLLCLIVALFLNRGVQKRAAVEYRRALRGWEAARGKALAEEESRDLKDLLDNVADEHRTMRDNNSHLQTERIKLEHALKDTNAKADDLERKIAKVQSSKEHSERAQAQLRDQYRLLEEQVSQARLTGGDTWFAAVVREALAKVEDAPEGEVQTKEAALLCRIRRLAEQSKSGLKKALQPVNIGDRIKQRAGDGLAGIKMLVSPFATNVYANPDAADLLIDRILDTIKSNREGELTLRVWRHRSVSGEERVRVALERTGTLERRIDVAHQGIAALAGATARFEKFGDERSALVFYFAAIESESDATEPRDLDAETMEAAHRESVRMIRSGKVIRRSQRVG